MKAISALDIVRKSRQEGKAMNIEIQQPELEALILDRMQSGAFATVEDVLLNALKATPWSSGERDTAQNEGSSVPTTADLIAAMQASPYKEINLEPSRDGMPVRNVGF